MIDKNRLELYWCEIPIGKENAIDYPALCEKWHRSEREVRRLLQLLSTYDNGDDYVLIRSAGGKGFYKTDDVQALKQYKSECLNKGRSIFAPIKKINRITSADSTQFSLVNNMRLFREDARMTQKEVVEAMRQYDTAFDNSLLSKMENGICLPTYYQLVHLSELYACAPDEIIQNAPDCVFF